MVEYINGLPEIFKGAFPYKDRPRSDGIYGVTEVLYCLRKSFLTRVIPAPTAIDFDTRRRFARGHAMEEIFFGDIQNPEYFVGAGDLRAIEGHADHIIRDDGGEITTVVEYKSTKKIWFDAPNGKKYYTITAAKKANKEEDWHKIERKYSDSHMDQLKTYMMITGAPKGILIYFEMTSDNNYTWTITSDEISDEFKDRMVGRLERLEKSMNDFVAPDKEYSYDWECKLCNFNSSGICTLCDQGGFDLKTFCNDVVKGKYNNKFDSIVEKYRKEYGVIPMSEAAAVNG